MRKYTYRIIDSIDKIEKTEWLSLFGDTPQGHGFYKTVESSNLEGFSFLYLLIYEETRLLLIAPLFIADFNLGIAVNGFMLKIIRCIRRFLPRFLIIKALFCGSPISENGCLGIKTGIENIPPLIDELDKIMRDICREKKISLIIFKDFLKDRLNLLKPLEDQGFFKVESFPTVVVDLPFKSMDEYFFSLSSNTRKNLRRKLKKTKETKNLEVKITDNINDIADQIYALYLNTYNAGSVRFEKLTKEFFVNASKYMPEETKFFLYYLEGKLAAFNFCLAYRNLLIDEFIGFDYALAYKYNLYFYSWCYNINWCLKNSIRHYQVGQTDYHPKLKLKGRPVPLYALIKHNNRVLNFSLRALARSLMPENFDDNIKQNGQE